MATNDNVMKQAAEHHTDVKSRLVELGTGLHIKIDGIANRIGGVVKGMKAMWIGYAVLALPVAFLIYETLTHGHG